MTTRVTCSQWRHCLMRQSANIPRSTSFSKMEQQPHLDGVLCSVLRRKCTIPIFLEQIWESAHAGRKFYGRKHGNDWHSHVWGSKHGNCRHSHVWNTSSMFSTASSMFSIKILLRHNSGRTTTRARVHDLSKIVDNGNDYIIIRTLVDSLKRLAAPKLD